MSGYENYMQLGEFDNVLVVDQQGITLYYDVADLDTLKRLGKHPEEFLGQPITSFYENLTADNSTMLKVLKTGEPLCDIEQEMKAKSGSQYMSRSSTFPINRNGELIGAIEFSKHYYPKDSSGMPQKVASHKIYRKNNTAYTIDDLITVDSKVLAVKEKVRRLARRDSNVLLIGETGTGKDLAAQSIHNASGRFTKPFITLNCAVIPEASLEVALFGIETEGGMKAGVFEQAAGGTLYLDEISSLDLTLQAKLLHVIEDKTIRRVGGKTDVRLDLRFIAAANEQPDVLVENNLLREDLYYRIGVVQVELPPLSKRKDDIPVLADHYRNYFNEHMNMKVESFDMEVLAAFQRYEWPGNVRELKNAVEMAFNQVTGQAVTLEDIPARIAKVREAEELQGQDYNLRDALDGYEKAMLVEAMKRSGGVLAEAARQLGVSKQSLKYKLDKYSLRS